MSESDESKILKKCLQKYHPVFSVMNLNYFDKSLWDVKISFTKIKDVNDSYFIVKIKNKDFKKKDLLSILEIPRYAYKYNTPTKIDNYLIKSDETIYLNHTINYIYEIYYKEIYLYVKNYFKQQSTINGIIKNLITLFYRYCLNTKVVYLLDMIINEHEEKI